MYIYNLIFPKSNWTQPEPIDRNGLVGPCTRKIPSASSLWRYILSVSSPAPHVCINVVYKFLNNFHNSFRLSRNFFVATWHTALILLSSIDASFTGCPWSAFTASDILAYHSYFRNWRSLSSCCVVMMGFLSSFLYWFLQLAVHSLQQSVNSFLSNTMLPIYFFSANSNREYSRSLTFHAPTSTLLTFPPLV